MRGSELFGAVPQIGDNIASATPTSTTSADLVSAATNTGGIIITSASLSVANQNANGAGTPKIQLLTDGDVVLECIFAVNTGITRTASQGGICAIEVPAGQAVSYSSDATNAGGFAAYVRISWRHK